MLQYSAIFKTDSTSHTTFLSYWCQVWVWSFPRSFSQAVPFHTSPELFTAVPRTVCRTVASNRHGPSHTFHKISLLLGWQECYLVCCQGLPEEHLGMLMPWHGFAWILLARHKISATSRLRCQWFWKWSKMRLGLQPSVWPLFSSYCGCQA